MDNKPKKKLEAKLFPYKTRKALWEMAKAHDSKNGALKFTIVAVWTYMWWRAGKGGLFELAEDLVCLDMGCDPKTLQNVHRILVAEGWLKKEKLRDKGGRWQVRGWTVIAKTTHQSTEVASVQDGYSPHTTQPRVAQTLMDSTTGGSLGHTVEDQLQDANASTDTSTPSASTPSDKLVSESVSQQDVSASPRRDEVRPANSQTSEVEDSGLKAERETLTEEQVKLLEAIQPMWMPFNGHEYGKTINEIEFLCEGVDADPFDILRWNRAHKKNGLAIRTPEQFLKALLGKDGEYAMLNEYKTHEHAKCKLCDAAGVEGPQAEPKAAAVGKGFEYEPGPDDEPEAKRGFDLSEI